MESITVTLQILLIKSQLISIIVQLLVKCIYSGTSLQWTLWDQLFLGHFCCYIPLSEVKMYQHGTIGTAKLVLNREVFLYCVLNSELESFKGGSTVIIYNYLSIRLWEQGSYCIRLGLVTTIPGLRSHMLHIHTASQS